MGPGYCSKNKGNFASSNMGPFRINCCQRQYVVISILKEKEMKNVVSQFFYNYELFFFIFYTLISKNLNKQKIKTVFKLIKLYKI